VSALENADYALGTVNAGVDIHVPGTDHREDGALAIRDGNTYIGHHDHRTRSRFDRDTDAGLSLMMMLFCRVFAG
jgi:hypothetical protein